MDLHSRATGDGGVIVGLRLSATEAEHLGEDARRLITLLGRALWAAEDLRHGNERAEWWPVLTDVQELRQRLGGIADAALREIPDASHGEVSAVLGESRATIAYRRQRGLLPPTVPTPYEEWARTGTLPSSTDH
ncbi:hypothetical protein [Streptomyces uncialis]|uniref:hypothetical protein n=1 Tax=Streptomyces uncialis TaxID=1048205 RepID=UPI00225ABF48|nr:hypothetical protein [Streptomyces uncialis]MCX4665055.1 hypothetical protein [Streptomyces uncialis]